MKKYASLFVAGLLAVVFTVSCGDQTPQTNTDQQVDDLQTTRTGQASAMQVTFQGKSITIEQSDIVAVAQKMNAANQDEQDVMNINASLMGAEKEAQALDVNFTMSDEPVSNGMFIFGMESQDAKSLTLEMHDEEGFAMVANNKFEITEGNNYKALNVKSLEDGQYNFRLKDEAGKELNKVVTIQSAK